MAGEVVTISNSFEHVALILSVAVPIASAAAAWAGVKIGLRSLTERANKIEIVQEKRTIDLKELKKDIDNTFTELRKEIALKVPVTLCGTERSTCHQDRVILSCEVSKQINLLASAITNQDDKRQLTNENNQRMFMQILEKVAEVQINVSKEISDMSNMLIERTNRFRPPKTEDFHK